MVQALDHLRYGLWAKSSARHSNWGFPLVIYTRSPSFNRTAYISISYICIFAHRSYTSATLYQHIRSWRNLMVKRLPQLMRRAYMKCWNTLVHDAITFWGGDTKRSVVLLSIATTAAIPLARALSSTLAIAAAPAAPTSLLPLSCQHHYQNRMGLGSDIMLTPT